MNFFTKEDEYKNKSTIIIYAMTVMYLQEK